MSRHQGMETAVENHPVRGQCGPTHYFFFLQPAQVRELRQLALDVNRLFEKSGTVGIVDLLYAALWRAVSMSKPPGSLTTLIVLDRHPQQQPGTALSSPAAARGGLAEQCTLCIPTEHLLRQPLVAIARYVASCLAIDEPYEGWLVDSWSPAAFTVSQAIDEHALVCSSATLCDAAKLLSPARDRHSADAAPRRWPLRMAAIDVGAECLHGSIAGQPPPEAIFHGDPAPAWFAMPSIDLWLPLAEIDMFRHRYGGDHFVSGDFLRN